MKKVNLFLFLSVFFLITSFSCKNNNIPRPVKGIIDLTNWDFDKNKTMNLNGEWEFYWQQMLTYEDFKNSKGQLSSYFKIPGTWYRYKLNNTGLDSFGYATYRLVIINNNNLNKDIALKIPKMSTAYNLFINEKKLISNGIPGISKSGMKPQYLPLAADFYSGSDRFEIIIQISNFNERLGGLRESIILGNKNDILKLKEFNLGFDLLLFGCVLLMAFYHLNLFILRKKDRVLLYFGLFCLVIAVRISISGELFLCQLFPYLSWELIRKVFALTFFIAVPVFAMFIRSLYINEFSKKILILIQSTGLFFTIITLFTPAIIYTHAIGIFNYFTFACCIYVIYVLIRALINKKEGALTFIIASLIFFTAVINDILYLETYIQSIMLVPYGLLIFIFFQVFMLGRRFSFSFLKIETMSDELQKVNRQINELNVNLEKKVQERTIELENAKNIIEITSREKSQFFINIAHEIKTPLTLIHNYLNSYIEKTGLNKDLIVIKQNFQKMLNDILNFFDTEKFEKGKIFYNHNQIINLSDTINEKIEIFKSNALNKNITLTENIDTDLYIKADPQAVERILNNLTDNAVKNTDS